MQPGDSGGGERRYGYGDKTEGECSLGTVVEKNGGMDTEIRQGECSLGTLVGENGGMDTEIRQWVSAAWGQWWRRTEVWMMEIRQRVSAAWGQWWRRMEVWIRR